MVSLSTLVAIIWTVWQFGGRGVMVEDVIPEEGATIMVAQVVSLVTKVFFEQVGEPDVTCHYCKEKDHTKFTCWKLTGKPTQPTRATNVASIQDDSSFIQEFDYVR